MKKINLVCILLIILLTSTSCLREKITLNTTLSKEDQIAFDKQKSETIINSQDSKKTYKEGDTIQYVNFDITIDELSLYENTINIKFGFTNKSQDYISFDSYGFISAFQDGISLDRIPTENEKEDFTFTKIQTGKTVPIYASYELRNYNTSVEIEFSDHSVKNTVIFEDFPEYNEVLNICDFYDSTLQDLINVFGDSYTISDEYYNGGKVVSFKDISIFFIIDCSAEDITSSKVTAALGYDGANILGDAIVGMNDKELSESLGCQIKLEPNDVYVYGAEMYCYLLLDNNMKLSIYFDSNNKSISAECYY